MDQVLDLNRFDLGIQPFGEFRFLGCNTPCALPPVTGTADTASHGNQRRSTDIHGISTETDDLCHISTFADPAACDNRYLVPDSLLA